MNRKESNTMSRPIKDTKNLNITNKTLGCPIVHVYGPHLRDYFDAEPKTIKAKSENDFSLMPDPVQDPIVSNNIAYQYFDYTYSDVLDVTQDDK